MLVYLVTLKSIKIDEIHSREIFIDSKTKDEAEKRLINTFDNLVSYKYLRKDNSIPRYIYDETSKIKDRVTKTELIDDYLKGKNSVKLREIMEVFSLYSSNACDYLHRLGFRYNKVTKMYERL